jgi:hypothetical protein
MRQGFIVTADGHIASALLPIGTPNALHVGGRLTFSRALDLGYAAQIEKGEFATVDFVDTLTGAVEVLMDTVHRGLHAWFNHIWLEPFGTEDILDGVMVVEQCAIDDIA